MTDAKLTPEQCKLVVDYHQLVKNITKKFAREYSVGAQDELLSYVNEDIVTLAQRYDPTKTTVDFSVFVKYRCKFLLIDHLRSINQNGMTNVDGRKKVRVCDQPRGESLFYNSNRIRNLEEAEELNRAMNMLRPMHAKMFRMHHVDGKTAAEIGETFGYSKSRTAVLLCQIRERLASILKGRETVS